MEEQFIRLDQCNFVNSSGLDQLPDCFLQFTAFTYMYLPDLYYREFKKKLNLQVGFDNNSASRDGNFLYGGLLDRCQMISINSAIYTDDHISYNFLKDSTVQMVHNNNTAISSQPYSMYFCDKNDIHDFLNKSISIRRNQNFTVSIIALAQGGIGVATEVTAILKSTGRLKLGQNRQIVRNECTTLTYSIYSSSDTEQVILYPEGPCHDKGLARVVIDVTLEPCPTAFDLSNEECICGEIKGVWC